MSSFWKDKKVFLTGHTGFKGAWLTLMLNHLGAKVTGYSLDVPTEPSGYGLTQSSELLVKDLRSDIRDLEKLKTALKESQAEIVFHLAAQPLVRLSYADPINTYSTNVMGTLNLLMACNETESVHTIVNVTTDKCYENHEVSLGYKETDHLGGHDPYSSSKACAEILSSSIRRSFLSAKNKKLSTVRAGNVIGGGDWAIDRLVPDFMRAHLAGVKLEIRNPSSVRPWQHVLDPLHAYLIIAENGLSEAFNIGPDSSDNKSVKDVVNQLLKYVPSHPGVETSARTGVHEANLLMLDCTKIKTKLGWKPRLNLDQALKLTGEWYQAEFDNKDLRALSLKQIENYFSLS